MVGENQRGYPVFTSILICWMTFKQFPVAVSTPSSTLSLYLANYSFYPITQLNYAYSRAKKVQQATSIIIIFQQKKTQQK